MTFTSKGLHYSQWIKLLSIECSKTYFPLTSKVVHNNSILLLLWFKIQILSKVGEHMYAVSSFFTLHIVTKLWAFWNAALLAKWKKKSVEKKFDSSFGVGIARRAKGNWRFAFLPDGMKYSRFLFLSHDTKSTLSNHFLHSERSFICILSFCSDGPIDSFTSQNLYTSDIFSNSFFLFHGPCHSCF